MRKEKEDVERGGEENPVPTMWENIFIWDVKQ